MRPPAQVVIAATVSLLLSLASCAEFLGPAESGTFTAEARPPDLELSNRTGAPVYYFAIEAELAARALWAPCTDPRACRSVAAGERTRIALDAVPGYDDISPERVLVYWWHLVPSTDGSFAAEDIRVVAVDL